MIGSVWTFHSGQICTAPTRAIVQRAHLRPGRRGPRQDGQRAEGRRPVRAGHGASARSSPPRTATASRATSRPAATKAARSSPAASGPRSPTRGYYVAPTLIAGCRPGMIIPGQVQDGAAEPVPGGLAPEFFGQAAGVDLGEHPQLHTRQPVVGGHDLLQAADQVLILQRAHIDGRPCGRLRGGNQNHASNIQATTDKFGTMEFASTPLGACYRIAI